VLPAYKSIIDHACSPSAQLPPREHLFIRGAPLTVLFEQIVDGPAKQVLQCHIQAITIVDITRFTLDPRLFKP
jgi:hypothetical protein